MSDEAVHYMESTSRLRAEAEKWHGVGRERLEAIESLRAENEELRERVAYLDGQYVQELEEKQAAFARAEAAEATMQEVAEEIRARDPGEFFAELTDRLSPPT